MSRIKRLTKLERVLGAPTADEVFWRAYEKYTRNLERVFAGHRGPDVEPLTRAEDAALRSRGIDGLVSWLWYGVTEEDVREMERAVP